MSSTPFEVGTTRSDRSPSLVQRAISAGDHLLPSPLSPSPLCSLWLHARLTRPRQGPSPWCGRADSRLCVHPKSHQDWRKPASASIRVVQPPTNLVVRRAFSCRGTCRPKFRSRTSTVESTAPVLNNEDQEDQADDRIGGTTRMITANSGCSACCSLSPYMSSFKLFTKLYRCTRPCKAHKTSIRVLQRGLAKMSSTFWSPTQVEKIV